jgi:thiamine-monophosphate kinase
MAALSSTDIIGGDTVRSTGPLTLSLTVLGRVAPQEMLTRSGAHPTDALFVTGTLGRAAAGLHVLDAGVPVPPYLAPAVQAQLRPQPRLLAGRALATSGKVTAMMDLSDGVATDVHRLCRMSQVGVIVEEGALPVDPVVYAACAWLAEHGASYDPLELSLTGGEDFELLFTAPPSAEPELRALLAPLPLTRIGVISVESHLLLQRLHRRIPMPWGFTHF